MNILKIKKLFIVLFLFASTSHAAVISLGCDDGDFEFFKYYLIKMDTNKKTAERTMLYIYGGGGYGYSIESEQQKKVKFTNLGDNHYQINHNLTYSTKAAINRANPADSRIWIDAQWWPFECELIPNEIIDLNDDKFKEYAKKQNTNIRNNILKSYDLLLNDKYNVVLNQKTIERVKNFFQ